MRLAAIFSFFTVLVPNVLAAWPPYEPSPALAIGIIQKATWNDQNDVLSGGTITVNNQEFIIPKNLLVNTPALTAVAWGDLFNGPDLNLPLYPEVAWEAHIYANYIGGQHIAGIVYIFQELGNTGQGFISHIDYDKGELRIGGTDTDPNSGVRVVISDPVGRFGLVHGDWPLWTADTENPSIAASTGFPVCVPRVDPTTGDDPLCPNKNRPTDTTGKPVSQFTFSAPPVREGQPDPNLFVPLRVGDSIMFSGTLVKDPDSDERIIAAFAIDANLGLYTAPGTVPMYLTINEEEFWVGVNGNPRGEIEQTRVEGFSTDPSATIQVYAVDVDPCTGEETERVWGSVVPFNTPPIGEFRFRSDSTALPPYTREVRLRVVTGTKVTPNGIIAGEFTAPLPPVGFAFPILLAFGDTALPFEFDKLPFLAEGSGPWLGGIPGVPEAATGPIVGQLSPWPGVTQPASISCPPVDPNAPLANAGPDLQVGSGAPVNLNGSLKKVIDTTGLTFKWSQTGGPQVALTGADTINATFTAPTVGIVTALSFTFEALNAAGHSVDDVLVNVVPGVADSITVESVTTGSGGGGTRVLSVVATTSSEASELFLSASNIQKVAMIPAGLKRFQLDVSLRTLPTAITITSSLGASVSIPVNNFAAFVPAAAPETGSQNNTTLETQSSQNSTAPANITSIDA